MNDDTLNGLFASNLRRLRHHRGMTQQAIANAAGTYTPAVSRMEDGRANPTIATLMKIAKALDVDPSDLLREPERCESCGQFLPLNHNDSVRAVGDET